MSNLRQYKLRRVKLKGGQVEPIEVSLSNINVLRFTNWGTAELRISLAADPQLFPQVIVGGNGATNNMLDPGVINRFFAYASTDIEFGLYEIEAEDPMLILAMESVVANLMTSLPPGTAHVGSVGINVGSTPVSMQDPLPVRLGRGSGLAPVKISAAAAGDVQVKGAAGRVYAIVTVGQAVVVKDAGVERWRVAAGAESVPPRPLECGTSIHLNFPAAGEAYVMFE